MNFDHFLVFVIEALIIVLVWPNLIQKHELVHHYGLEKEDPGLTSCYRVWRWSVPIISLIMLVLVYYSKHLFRSEIVVFYFFYPLVSVVIGFYIGEIISNQLIITERDYNQTSSL